MHYKPALSMLVVAIACSALAKAVVQPADPAFCTGTSCSWGAGGTTGALECSCNAADAPPAGQSYLAAFYTQWAYKGLQYNAFGQTGECYNLPLLWSKNVGSVTKGWDTPECWLFTQPDCATQSAADNTALTNGISSFSAPFDQKIMSYQCDPSAS